ncbi:hypothetical protein D1007_43896 [Hordeum vulgare]|nr:hypothetical protein D1007_43896 [Hordeum vulgare]
MVVGLVAGSRAFEVKVGIGGNLCQPGRHRRGDACGCRRTFLEGVGGDPSSCLVTYQGKPLAAASSSSRSFLEAKFKITLEVSSEMVALSNMPISSETLGGSMKIIHFEESPLMSTYLVAMVVGIFDFVEDVTSKGTKVRVYTEVGKSSQGKFALDVGMKSLDFYNDYFGTPYALAKLDMIGIPDFNMMGMENYGLITFHPPVFLCDDSSTTSTKLQEAAYLSVMQNVSSSNRSKYDSLRKLYKNLGDEDEKLRVLGTLCFSWDKDIVLESLNLIFTNEIPSYHAVYVLKGIGIDAREMTWSWLKENWDRVLKVIPERDLMWSIINDILPLFTTNDKAEEIAKVFTNYPDPEIQSALQEKLQMVRINMRWIDGIRSEPKLAHTVHELLHKP